MHLERESERACYCDPRGQHFNDVLVLLLTWCALLIAGADIKLRLLWERKQDSHLPFLWARARLQGKMHLAHKIHEQRGLMTGLVESGLGGLKCTSRGRHAQIWFHHLDMGEARIGESPSLISGKKDSSHQALERSDWKMWTAEDHWGKDQKVTSGTALLPSLTQFKNL